MSWSVRFEIYCFNLSIIQNYTLSWDYLNAFHIQLVCSINKDIKYKIWYCYVKALEKLDESVDSLSSITFGKLNY